MKPEKTATKPLSVFDFNEKSACENYVEMPYLDSSGKETGMVVHVIGAQAQTVRDMLTKCENKRKAIMFPPHGKGRDLTNEEQREININGHACRVVGWSGVEETYSHELAVKICDNNVSFYTQVVECSENITLFTQSKPSN